MILSRVATAATIASVLVLLSATPATAAETSSEVSVDPTQWVDLTVDNFLGSAPPAFPAGPAIFPAAATFADVTSASSGLV